MAGPVREGNLEGADAPSARLAESRFLRRGRAPQGDGAGLRHLPRLPALRQPVPVVPDPVRSRRQFAKAMEVDGVAKSDYAKVVEHCYLCDLCYMTKCPYVPPHAWSPRLSPSDAARQGRRVPQGRDQAARQGCSPPPTPWARRSPIRSSRRSSTRSTRSDRSRERCEAVAGIDADAWLPPYAARPLRSRLAILPSDTPGEPAGRTTGKVALFATCYINRNEPGPGRGSRRRLPAQRHSGDADAAREMLRHAQARARRSRERSRAAQGVQHSHAGEAGRPGLRPDRAECRPAC